MYYQPQNYIMAKQHLKMMVTNIVFNDRTVFLFNTIYGSVVC